MKTGQLNQVNSKFLSHISLQFGILEFSQNSGYQNQSKMTLFERSMNQIVQFLRVEPP